MCTIIIIFEIWGWSEKYASIKRVLLCNNLFLDAEEFSCCLYIADNIWVADYYYYRYFYFIFLDLIGLLY